MGVNCVSHQVLGAQVYQHKLKDGSTRTFSHEARCLDIYDDVVFYPYVSGVSAGDVILRETTHEAVPTQSFMFKHGYYGKYPIRKIRDVCTSIGYGNRSNYFHYHIDCLTRLFSLHQSFCQDLPSIVLLNTKQLSAEEEAVLHALLPKNVKLEVAAQKERIHADRYLFLPFFTRRGAGYLPAPIRDFLIPRVINALNAKSDRNLPRKIYISRRRAELRKFINEDEVAQNLEKQGYETVVLEDLSLRKQVSIFLGATHVVACHGAGLANLIFSPPGVSVLEIFPNAEGRGTYEMLSLCKEHRYSALKLNQSSFIHSDSRVPVRKLMRLVRGMEVQI